MATDLRISPRERLVLTAIVENYIATGEPVASQVVAHRFGSKDGMSSATIRNVMANLGEAGLLEQPHTSAGRIPTARAFRFYVEQLSGYSRLAPGTLSQERRDQIEDSFAGVNSSQQFLESTSHVLALLSSGVGLRWLPVLRRIRWSTFTSPGSRRAECWQCLVTMAGAVLDRVLVLDRDL